MGAPIYRAAVVITLDGKIALSSNQFTNWSSKEDKVIFRKMLDESDVIIVGHNTYKVAAEFLDKRNCIVFTRSVGKTLQFKKGILFLNPQNVDFPTLIKNSNYKLITIIGGAPTFSYFLKNNLLDELHITVEPLIFGKGIPLFEDVEVPTKNFELVAIKRLNKKGSLLLSYVSKKN